jgi:hypothetical protein
VLEEGASVADCKVEALLAADASSGVEGRYAEMALNNPPRELRTYTHTHCYTQRRVMERCRKKARTELGTFCKGVLAVSGLRLESRSRTFSAVTVMIVC